MDPTVCFDNMLKAVLDRNLPDAHEYADALVTWLRKGGFAPLHMPAHAALDIARAILLVCEEYLVDDACPSCGSAPGDGLTEGCEDENGCGYWREHNQPDEA